MSLGFSVTWSLLVVWIGWAQAGNLWAGGVRFAGWVFLFGGGVGCYVFPWFGVM